MPLNASSSIYLHILQNLALIAISLFLAPFCTCIAICSSIASPYTTTTKQIQHKRQWRASSSSTFRPRVILVTGVGMSKGLAIARAFYREGHNVIGADFEPSGVPVCGRFSTALKKFYKLIKPEPGPNGSKTYVDGLLTIIEREGVELWVSCSGVASAMEDAEAAEAVERLSDCKAIQFGTKITETLHEKHSFIQQTKSFGLNIPQTHLITSVDDAMTKLYPEKPRSTESHYIMKSVGLDDSVRADMTLLPRLSAESTEMHLVRLHPSPSRPFVLQQFIDGPEYCTHSLVVQGRVVAFTACPSAELLMHYQALPHESALSKAMQKYTEIYAKKMGHVTGHFSIDFMLDGDDSGFDLLRRLYPIECNPRAHTAVVLFDKESKDMVDAYLSVLKNDKTSASEPIPVVIPSTTTGYYWIGHDVVVRVLLPLLSFVRLQSRFSNLLKDWKQFLERLIYWKDGTYEIWDPWPFWWLYCVYWPGMFLSAVLTRNWWSRCNVSTTKMFRC